MRSSSRACCSPVATCPGRGRWRPSGSRARSPYLVKEDTYQAASDAYDLLVKTHPADAHKIAEIKRLFADHLRSPTGRLERPHTWPPDDGGRRLPEARIAGLPGRFEAGVRRLAGLRRARPGSLIPRYSSSSLSMSRTSPKRTAIDASAGPAHPLELVERSACWLRDVLRRRPAPPRPARCASTRRKAS